MGVAKVAISIIGLACISMGLSACQTTSGSSDRPLQDYPETMAYMTCVRSKAVQYAHQQDSAIDLAAVAVSYCRPERNGMGRALVKDNSPAYVDILMARVDVTMAEFAAQDILDARNR